MQQLMQTRMITQNFFVQFLEKMSKFFKTQKIKIKLIKIIKRKWFDLQTYKTKSKKISLLVYTKVLFFKSQSQTSHAQNDTTLQHPIHSDYNILCKLNNCRYRSC